MPVGKQAECASDSDCNTSVGEVCEQGACWGGPPAGEFAAIVVPPNQRPDLISTEIAMQTLPTDGALGSIAVGSAIKLSGRVEAFCAAPMTCSDTTIAATITVTRPSRFAGGPPFTAVATAADGVARGTDSFSIAVPPSQPGDAPFTITVAPAGAGAAPPNNGSTAPAELAPPLRLTMTAHTDTELGTLTLGSESSAVISGTLTDAQQAPLTKYRVVALGHLGDAGAALSQASTVDYTTNGQYSITLSDNIVGTISIEASPYDPSVTAPTLIEGPVQPASGTQALVQPASMGNPVARDITIEGLSGEGAVTPVSGAHVFVTGTFAPGMVGLGQAVLEADVQTGDDGVAHVTLLDGDAFANSYTIEVIPPTGSELGAYDKPLVLDGSPIRLPTRFKLTGKVVDASGKGVGNISVTAAPSLRFQWSLPDDGQSVLAAIPPATVVTDAAGAFTLYVDPILESVWAYYDLEFTVPDGVQTASWTHSEIAIPRDPTQSSLMLTPEPLPDTAFMHGNLLDSAGISLAGGELRIFELEPDASLCLQVANPPAGCSIPAQLLGHGTSVAAGTVQLALPRDPATP